MKLLNFNKPSSVFDWSSIIMPGGGFQRSSPLAPIVPFCSPHALEILFIKTR